MDFNVPVTMGAKTRLRKKLMEFCPMASGALHPFIKEMLLMAGGPPDGVGFRDRTLKMTLDTDRIRDDDLAMSWRNRRWTFEKKARDQLSPLYVRELVAVMAVYPLMHTLGPFGIGRIHDMAGGAEPRVILGVVIEFVTAEGGCAEKYKNHDHQHQRWNHGEPASYSIKGHRSDIFYLLPDNCQYISMAL